MNRLLYCFIFLAVFSSCSERLKNDLNHYGRALENYPESIVIPAEGGSYELVFESNFSIYSDLSGGSSESFEAVTIPVVDKRYYHKDCIRIIADSNSTGAERRTTLVVSYSHPAVIMPIYALTVIGEYYIIQPSLP
jgi:hypothetical protein